MRACCDQSPRLQDHWSSKLVGIFSSTANDDISISVSTGSDPRASDYATVARTATLFLHQQVPLMGNVLREQYLTGTARGVETVTT